MNVGWGKHGATASTPRVVSEMVRPPTASRLCHRNSPRKPLTAARPRHSGTASAACQAGGSALAPIGVCNGARVCPAAASAKAPAIIAPPTMPSMLRRLIACAIAYPFARSRIPAFNT